jgi:hypothetical protein
LEIDGFGHTRSQKELPVGAPDREKKGECENKKTPGLKQSAPKKCI